MYEYIEIEPGVYTVGHYDCLGRWHPVADWPTVKEARECVDRLTEKSLKEEG